MQFYDISFMHPYKQFGGCQDVFDKQTSGCYEKNSALSQNFEFILH
jgi:hypothetical protein